MPRGERQRRWPTWRRDAFARDWRDGMESGALREKYGVVSPASVAAGLRRQGYVLPARPRGQVAW